MGISYRAPFLEATSTKPTKTQPSCNNNSGSSPIRTGGWRNIKEIMLSLLIREITDGYYIVSYYAHSIPERDLETCSAWRVLIDCVHRDVLLCVHVNCFCKIIGNG